MMMLLLSVSRCDVVCFFFVMPMHMLQLMMIAAAVIRRPMQRKMMLSGDYSSYY